MSEVHNGENDRPLSRLGVAEIRTEIATLRGEMWKEVTRLDGINDGRDKALELQASEYERRLTDLNHEAARINKAQSESVSVDKFDGYKEANDQRIKKLETVGDRMWIPILLMGGVAAGVGAAITKFLFP